MGMRFAPTWFRQVTPPLLHMTSLTTGWTITSRHIFQREKKTKLGCQKKWGWCSEAWRTESRGVIFWWGGSKTPLHHLRGSVVSSPAGPEQTTLSYIWSPPDGLSSQMKSCFCACCRFCTSFLWASTIDGWV